MPDEPGPDDLSPLAAETAAGLSEFRDAIRAGDPVAERFRADDVHASGFRAAVVQEDDAATTWACGPFRASAFFYGRGVWGWSCWEAAGPGRPGAGGFTISRQEARRRALEALAGAAEGVADG